MAIERLERMSAHHACEAATRALWALRPRVALAKTVSAGAGSASTVALAPSLSAAPSLGAAIGLGAQAASTAAPRSSG